MKKLFKPYTDKEIEFLRENYENTHLTLKELVKLFNKRFRQNKGIYAIRRILKIKGIRKNQEILREIQSSNMIENRKKCVHPGPHKKYGRDFIAFMRKISKQGLTKTEARKKCEIEFMHNVSKDSFNNLCQRYKIKYVFPQVKMKEENIPKIFKSEDFKDFLRNQKGINMYRLRDKIIERFKENVSIRLLREFIKNDR